MRTAQELMEGSTQVMVKYYHNGRTKIQSLRTALSLIDRKAAEITKIKKGFTWEDLSVKPEFCENKDCIVADCKGCEPVEEVVEEPKKKTKKKATSKSKKKTPVDVTTTSEIESPLEDSTQEEQADKEGE